MSPWSLRSIFEHAEVVYRLDKRCEELVGELSIESLSIANAIGCSYGKTVQEGNLEPGEMTMGQKDLLADEMNMIVDAIEDIGKNDFRLGELRRISRTVHFADDRQDPSDAVEGELLKLAEVILDVAETILGHERSSVPVRQTAKIVALEEQ